LRCCPSPIAGDHNRSRPSVKDNAGPRCSGVNLSSAGTLLLPDNRGRGSDVRSNLSFLRNKGLAKRKVEVHWSGRAGPRSNRCTDGTDHKVTQVGIFSRPSVRCRNIGKEPRSITENAHLIGGLVGASSAQLVGPICSKNKEWHTAMGCLENGGVDVRHRST
jgi:hypothetical protein